MDVGPETEGEDESLQIFGMRAFFVYTTITILIKTFHQPTSLEPVNLLKRGLTITVRPLVLSFQKL